MSLRDDSTLVSIVNSWRQSAVSALSSTDEYATAVPMNAYNAVTPIEATAVERLIKNVQARPGGRRLDTVMWAASGSEAIQKALWRLRIDSWV